MSESIGLQPFDSGASSKNEDRPTGLNALGDEGLKNVMFRQEIAGSNPACATKGKGKTMFKQNDRVYYDANGLKGEGLIVGTCMAMLPVLGKNYIIQDLSGNLPNEVYPFTHFACFEVWLQKVP